MNGIHRNTGTFDLLDWRDEDIKYQQEEYIPFLLNKLNTKYSTIENWKISDLSDTDDCEGYRYSNLKMLNVTLKTIGGTAEINVKLPTPSADDIFVINRNPYILINQYIDDLYYFYNKDLFTVSFRINHNTGGWVAFKGSQAKAQKQIPLILVLHYLKLLDSYFTNVEFVKELPENCEVWIDEDTVSEKFVHKIHDELYFIADSIDVLTNTRDLIIKSISLMHKFDLNNNAELTKVAKFVEAQNPFEYSYEYEFVHGYCDLPTLYTNMLREYDNDVYHRFDEIHLKFKRVKYYSQVLTPLANKIKNIRNIFDRAKNLTQDISWKQRIPANIMTKYLKKYKHLQYLELNAFTEIDMKYKLVTPLKNVPKYMRSTAYTGFQSICPLNTPDNKNIGAVQSLVASVDLDKNGKFNDIQSII